MYKYIIDSAGQGLNPLALLALLTFFSLLVIAIVAAIFRKQSFHKHMAALPLEFDSEGITEQQVVDSSAKTSV